MCTPGKSLKFLKHLLMKSTKGILSKFFLCIKFLKQKHWKSLKIYLNVKPLCLKIFQWDQNLGSCLLSTTELLCGCVSYYLQQFYEKHEIRWYCTSHCKENQSLNFFENTWESVNSWNQNFFLLNALNAISSKLWNSTRFYQNYRNIIFLSK